MKFIVFRAKFDDLTGELSSRRRVDGRFSRALIICLTMI
jgi:hypothetical protein